MKELTLQELTKELYGVEVTISKGVHGYFASGAVIGKVRSSLGYEATLRQLWFAIEHNIHAIRTVYELNTANREALGFSSDSDEVYRHIMSPEEQQNQVDAAVYAEDVEVKIKTCADCTYLHDTFKRNEQHMCNTTVSPKVWTNSSDEVCEEFIAKTPQSES